MARKEYLLEQKQMGRRLLGVFPAQYPKEVLWAMNILPVEIWDPPVESSNANAHLQPYICSVVKQGLELILQGKADMLDGFLFPHTCDSIQNLASIINDYLKLEKPCFFFYHPKAPYPWVFQGLLSGSNEIAHFKSRKGFRTHGPGCPGRKHGTRGGDCRMSSGDLSSEEQRGTLRIQCPVL